MTRVVLVGESWFTYSVHQKGFDAFHTSQWVDSPLTRSRCRGLSEVRANTASRSEPSVTGEHPIVAGRHSVRPCTAGEALS